MLRSVQLRIGAREGGVDEGARRWVEVGGKVDRLDPYGHWRARMC